MDYKYEKLENPIDLCILCNQPFEHHYKSMSGCMKNKIEFINCHSSCRYIYKYIPRIIKDKNK